MGLGGLDQPVISRITNAIKQNRQITPAISMQKSQNDTCQALHAWPMTTQLGHDLEVACTEQRGIGAQQHGKQH
jgi:hypothetical protein